MKRVLVMMLVLFTLGGCASLGMGVVDAINPMKEDKGVSATVQLGKENTNVDSKQLVKLNNKEDYTNSTIGTIDNSTNFPWWALVLTFIVGILVRPIDFIKDWRSSNE